MQYKTILQATVEEAWEWEPRASDNSGRQTSRIYKELAGVSLFNKNDWPQLISFFKPRIIALDSFWSDAKYGVEGLGR